MGSGMTEAGTVVAEAGRDFIRDIIEADLAAKRHTTVVTRFPPEPNGYLHIGHAKSIYLNFGIAQEFGGRCHLRFDDTNPTKEEQEYIDAIERDVRWLGFDWGTHLYHASDYFEQLYQWAEHLIRIGKAYVDDQSQEEMRIARGTLTEPGRNSPWRGRIPEENLDLFRRMRAGEFPMGRGCYGPRSIWPPATSICAIRCSTAFYTRAIRAPAQPGASIPAMTSPMANRMPSSTSHTRSAGSNLRTTGPCTTGSSNTCRFHPTRGNTSSPASISPIRCSPSAYSRNWCVVGTSRAGMILACRRWQGCAGAACRRRRCAISSSGSGLPRPTAWSMWPCSTFRSAKFSTKRRCDAWRCCAP